MVENLPANAGDARDAGSILESGRSPGVGNGNLLQYSCLENPMDREARSVAVHGVAKVRHDLTTLLFLGLPWWLSGKESACNVEAAGDSGLIPELRSASPCLCTDSLSAFGGFPDFLEPHFPYFA